MMRRIVLLLSSVVSWAWGFELKKPGLHHHAANKNTKNLHQYFAVKSQRNEDLSELDKMKRLLDEELGMKTTDRDDNLTFGARQRMELELELLRRLEASDESIDCLMDLWIHEAPSAIREIDVIRLFEQHCESLELAERSLRPIVSTYSHCWAEPMNRLALVVALQGRYEEAMSLIDAVLLLKPWHFEAQHMKVLLTVRLHGVGKGVKEARATLPPLSRPKRRRDWVNQAVRQAEMRLQDKLDRSERSKQSVLLDDTGESSSVSSWA